MTAFVDKESQEYLWKKAQKKAKKNKEAEEQTIRIRKSNTERKEKGLAEKERQSKMTAEEKKAEEDEIWKKEYDLEQERKEKGKEKTKKRHIERKKERAEEKTKGEK